MKIVASIFLAVFLAASTAGAQEGTFADVVVVVDESGSMSTEHAWLQGPDNQSVMVALERALTAAGVAPVRFGLVGFPGQTPARLLEVGGAGQPFGDGLRFEGTAGGLTTGGGGTEDGYCAIQFALGAYPFTAGPRRNIILVTDEDRDVLGFPECQAIDLPVIRNNLAAAGVVLNVIVNGSFSAADGTSVLGVALEGSGGEVAYVEDGAGGFVTVPGPVNKNGDGTTVADYVDLALELGGAAWDLNKLRQGGFPAQSFTNAFIDVKVREIASQGLNLSATVGECWRDEVLFKLGVTPSFRTVSARGGEASFDLSAGGAPRSWTASGDAPWLELPGGRTARGTGDMTVRVAPNDGPARSATLSVVLEGSEDCPRSLRVAQNGTPDEGPAGCLAGGSLAGEVVSATVGSEACPVLAVLLDRRPPGEMRGALYVRVQASSPSSRDSLAWLLTPEEGGGASLRLAGEGGVFLPDAGRFAFFRGLLEEADLRLEVGTAGLEGYVLAFETLCLEDGLEFAAENLVPIQRVEVAVGR